jgi:hypothetical protein
MSLQRMLVTLVGLALIWASHGSLAMAQDNAKKMTVEDRLRQPITINFKEVPLQQAIKRLSAMSGIRIEPDLAALRDACIDMDASVFISVANIELKYALKLMLDQLRLRFIVEKDVLYITTQGKATRVVYPVADLVSLYSTSAKDEKYAELLREHITNTVAKNCWESAGGSGTIQYVPGNKTLVVNQPLEIQEEVASVLAGLREMYSKSVSLEVRFIETSPKGAEACRKELTMRGRQTTSALIKENHLQKWLEIVQFDRSGAIIQAPKVMVFSDEKVPFECVQKEVLATEFRDTNVDRDSVLTVPSGIRLASATKQDLEPKKAKTVVVAQREFIRSGWKCDVQSVVSADRKSVRVSVNLEHVTRDKSRDVEHLMRASKTFDVPEASTLVWDLGESAGQCRFILITPRVQVQQEPEKIFLGEQEPIPGR